MLRPSLLLLLSSSLLLFSLAEAKTLDPYKVLGVDKGASQRDIQKAFHKLSLQYHPDKNKNKGAQEKFAQINNAYEILSDEEKRKNYDMYGDEKGNPGFNGGNFGGQDGYTYFSGDGPGNNHFSFRPDGWQRMGGQDSQSFSFSFGGPGAGSSSFGFGDIFSNFFGGDMKSRNQFGGFGGSAGPKSGFSSPITIQSINAQFFNKEIADQGLTWLLLSYTPTSKEYHIFESALEEVAGSLQGAAKAGSINCQNEQVLCKELGIFPARSARVFVYSFRSNERGSLVEFSGELDAKNLKKFCQDHLPRYSKRVDLSRFDFSSVAVDKLPQLLLLSSKKDTPVIWRVLSGLYRKHFIFYDAEVPDTSDSMLKKLGVDALPAVVGMLVNGEKHVLKTGIVVKDLKSGINEMKVLLESFEKKNKKVASSQAKKPSQSEPRHNEIPHLTTTNFDNVCGEKTAVCIIGVYRSSKAKDKLQTYLSNVSRKTLTRRQNQVVGSGDSVSYALLDATKHSSFLSSFDKSGYKSSDRLLVAYKPQRRKFAVFTDEMTLEGIEGFISSVLNGDVQFSKVRQKPVLK
ncbi:hypothetical protein QJS10_CPA03g01186 [Acorus calamus]|uniref:J domain-containing protein n=1 Tax=Acorus calamus TaxID=4465 RepID=A0AAV9F948_ACOCL|nr:hypothetical protein QJS10_CPA03g01186 [Acorus calamus]